MRSLPLRVVLLGIGAINTRVAELLHAGKQNVSVVGIVSRHTAPRALAAFQNAKWVRSPEDLAALSPDIILEAASRDAVQE